MKFLKHIPDVKLESNYEYRFYNATHINELSSTIDFLNLPLDLILYTKQMLTWILNSVYATLFLSYIFQGGV